MSGKSDAIDAEHAARTLLSGKGSVTPKLADGQIESIRLIKIARDTAVSGHSRTIITLKSVLVTASDELRSRLEPLTNHKLVLACAELDTAGKISDPQVAMNDTLACLALRWLTLHEEIKIHTARLKALTKAAAPQLLERFGIGFDSAAEMLVTAVATPIVYRRRQHSLNYAGPVPSPQDQVKPLDGIDSIAAGTVKLTLRSTGSLSSGRDGTHKPSPTSNDAPNKAPPRPGENKHQKNLTPYTWYSIELLLHATCCGMGCVG